MTGRLRIYAEDGEPVVSQGQFSRGPEVPAGTDTGDTESAGRIFDESGPRKGQLWEDRGATCVVWSVAEDGSAILLTPAGHKVPVGPSFFKKRGKLVRDV